MWIDAGDSLGRDAGVCGAVHCADWYVFSAASAAHEPMLSLALSRARARGSAARPLSKPVANSHRVLSARGRMV